MADNRRRRMMSDDANLFNQMPGHTVEDLIGPLNESEQKNKPPILYLVGDHSLLAVHPKVSIVGSRKASPEGLRRAAKLTRELVARQVVIVSGLAEGIDGTAHRTAMDSGGRTIAVLGTPLNEVYPKSHRNLQAEIAEHHLLISQFAPGQPIRKANFPMRNRTMAMLVDASVIIEAGEGSGTLSQGWEALRLGRPLFLLRSVVETSGLKWPAQMLDYGARVLTETDELVERLPYGDRLAAIPA